MSNVIGTTVRTWRQDTPIGPIAVTVGDHGIRRIVFGAQAGLGAGDGETVPVETGRGHADAAVARELDEWFAGTRTAFTVPVDLSGIEGFRRAVLETLRREIAWGETVTYGELAALAGRPGAARAVGRCMASNPAPFVVPCHRVVAANGIGGYGGTADHAAANLDLKRWLLRHEGVAA